MLCSGIVIGILIDVVYTELFTCFAHWLAGQGTRKPGKIMNDSSSTSRIHSKRRLSLYFWILALIFIPFGSESRCTFCDSRTGVKSLSMYIHRNDNITFLALGRTTTVSARVAWSVMAGSDALDWP